MTSLEANTNGKVTTSPDAVVSPEPRVVASERQEKREKPRASKPSTGQRKRRRKEARPAKDAGPISSAHPVARSVRPDARDADAGRGGKAFFVLASLLLAGTALWAFNSEPDAQGEASLPPRAAAPAPAVDPTPVQAPLPAAARGPETAPAPAAASVDVPSAPESPPPTAAEVGAAFDQRGAARALSEGAAKAGGCRKAGDPSGVTQVQVTFAPSGTVTRAVVPGKPFANTRTAQCIADKMRAITVPPFDGDPVTIGQNISVL